MAILYAIRWESMGYKRRGASILAPPRDRTGREGYITFVKYTRQTHSRPWGYTI
jgi:hypothetical protein